MTKYAFEDDSRITFYKIIRTIKRLLEVSNIIPKGELGSHFLDLLEITINSFRKQTADKSS